MFSERLLRRLGPKVRALPMVAEHVRLNTYPPPFPAGWYPLCASDEVEPGQTKFIQALGEQLVVYRANSGRLGLLDAYCPHLGSNLAGGRVRGECIECPFHRWNFAADGQVQSIPNVDTPARSLKTRAWSVREIDGHIAMWFSPDRAKAADASYQPDYELEPLEEVDDGRLVFRGQHDAGTIRMHLCEFAENSVDFQHFGPIHGKMMVPWLGFKIPGVNVQHVASWEADAEHSHKAYFCNEAVIEIAGRVFSKTRASATITFYGPAGFTTFRITLPELGDIVIYHTHLPVEPLLQHVRFRWYAAPNIPRLLVSYVVGNWIAQWREDIAIWENKVYRSKPMLIANDGPVHKMRRWFSQFYPAQKDVVRAAAE